MARLGLGALVGSAVVIGGARRWSDRHDTRSSPASSGHDSVALPGQAYRRCYIATLPYGRVRLGWST